MLIYQICLFKILSWECGYFNIKKLWFLEMKLLLLSQNNVCKIWLFIYKKLPGDYCKGVTPDPIPNSAVKPFSANGTLS